MFGRVTPHGARTLLDYSHPMNNQANHIRTLKGTLCWELFY
jgi:hypothetical protein